MDDLRWAADLGWIAVLAMTALMLLSTRRGVVVIERIGTIGFALAVVGATVMAGLRFAAAL